MNDEEKKAVKYFRHTLDNPDTKFWIGTNGIKNIDIILNLVEKQQAEIEKKKERIEYLERSISRKEHSLVEEEQDNVELETKLQEKDNIIDLMAEQLVKAHEWFYSEFDNYTKEDFIEYFENKVKESK